MPVQGEKLILGLSALLQLNKRAFAAENEATFGFLVVNETHLMTPYRQAVLWRHADKGSGAVVAVSGSPDPNARAPYIVWLTRILNNPKWGEQTGPVGMTAADIEGDDGKEWEQWLPNHAIWVPLITGARQRMGGMLLVKAVPWTDPEIKLLTKLADSYANAWELLLERARGPGWSVKELFATPATPWRWGVVALLPLLLLLPVRQSVLAPAVVVAHDPAPIRAPLDGVVERVHVQPNQTVRHGELLITLDEAPLKSKLEVEERNIATLEEEYHQVLKLAVTDVESRIQKNILEKRLARQRAEADGIRILLRRTRIEAPRDGVALFNDVHAWLGKPVQVGERVMEIAAPDRAELEIRLPVADVMAMEPDAEVTLYPNLDPLSTWRGNVTRVAYEAREIEGVLAHAVRARFAEEQPMPRIGLRGTAKIQGGRTTLFHYLFRHPLTLLRQRLGL
ncbi:MAG: HlyD family efflux transporter periplasmic adaptor subunit [Magnetococcales bacterium]|nr:HlyD family efflux transporter periplasmic adaptor subunit [Magnetococcales bacterium]